MAPGAPARARHALNPHTYQTLEFDKVLAAIARGAATPAGADLVYGLRPDTDPDEVLARNALLREVMELLAAGRPLAVEPLPDVRPALERAATTGAVLAVEELTALRAFLRQIPRLVALAGSTPARDWPAVSALLGRFQPAGELLLALEQTFDDEGRVRDEATPALREIRADLRHTRRRVQQRLEQMLQAAEIAPHLQEQFVTFRSGRHVLPVRVDAQAKVPGLIHDRSDSGQTVFVEPLSVVEMGNRIAELEARQRAEVRRILRELSERVGYELPVLTEDHHALTRLDAVATAARFGLDRNMAAPAIEPQRPDLVLRAARHPLLEEGRRAEPGSEGVVPLDLEVGRAARVLVITGSNTGGKTVALKTAGLLCLMAQAGLPVPADVESRLPVYRQILVDVGDEQSIEQSLSTFSGHLRQICSILDAAGPGTLVLLDELGAGTDPREGGALACAILVALRDGGATAIATTHLGQVKIFVHGEAGMENAAVQFDPETLRPTFRLVLGQPGSSHALRIAQRLGMPRAVLDRAGSFLEQESANLEQMLLDMNAARARLQEDLGEARRLRGEAEEVRARWQKEQHELREQRKRLLREARQEALNIVRGAHRTVDQAIREAQAAQRAAATPQGESIESVRRRLSRRRQNLQAGIAELTPRARPALRWEDVRLGLPVFVPSLDALGEIVAVDPRRQRLAVRVGALRLQLEPRQLARTEDPDQKPPPAPAPPSTLPPRTAREAPPVEVNLIGQRVEPAMSLLERQLEHASISGLAELRIVHGYGTGTLRRAVAELLRRHPLVTSYHHPPLEHGGQAVTIAVLK